MHKRVLNCLTNKRYKGIPIWFMRQAGRHLPEFKNIRDKNPNYINLCSLLIHLKGCLIISINSIFQVLHFHLRVQSAPS